MYVALEPSTDLRVSDITSVRAPARCADGNGTLDAMASVLPAQLPALQSEIAAVLA